MSTPGSPGTFSELATALAAVGRRFYARNWVLGTSGNFSAVAEFAPLRLIITPSAANKGTLAGTEFLTVNEHGVAIGATPRPPSAETAIHLEIVRARRAGAVLHTHSVWGTILSELHGDEHGIAIAGFEMLKGLAGVATHEHREWIPIVPNDQDMPRLAAVVGRILAEQPTAHAVLLRGHGLYTWGATIADAERHVEILEFLFEVIGRIRREPCQS